VHTPRAAAQCSRCGGRRPRRARPRCDEMTVQEGLDEYFAANPGLTRFDPDSDDPAAELFLPHDVCHVLFGCGTSIAEEAMADTWTIFGSDVGLTRYVKMFRHVAEIDPKGVVQKLGIGRTTLHMFLAVVPSTQAWWRARSMTKRWAWDRYRESLDRSLGELRRAHGIRIFVPRASLRQASAVGLEA
ncbi:MAG: hypothetical protein AAF721_10355, partial [Myxococcota bacterium]